MTPGRWPDTLWLTGADAIAVRRLDCPGGRRGSRVALVTRRQVVLPAVFALVAVGVQMYDHFDRVSVAGDLALRRDAGGRHRCAWR